jgi:hypothetical protein
LVGGGCLLTPCRAMALLYVQVLKRFNLKDRANFGWGARHRVGTNLKWTPNKDGVGARLPPADVVREQMAAEMAASLRRPTKRLGNKMLSLAQHTSATYNLRIMAMRRAKIEFAWRERLRGAAKYMPKELEDAGMEKQRQKALEQREEMTMSEIVARGRKDRGHARRKWAALAKKSRDHFVRTGRATNDKARAAAKR